MQENSYSGPLHLQRYLSACTDSIADIIRSSVGHPVSIVHSLHCHCQPSGLMKAVSVAPPSGSGVHDRTADARRRNIESSRRQKSVGDADAEKPENDRRMICRFFSMSTNDEDGVVHTFCKRCDRMILVYDRALYWGIKRPANGVPAIYPYKCSCGSHTFEVAIGLSYPEEALDENDVDMITIAVRCATCAEIAIVFDDEAT
jgi:hypothetical protein